MKKLLALLLVACSLFYSSANAEKSTVFSFPEFSVYIPDSYVTITKQNVRDVVGSNTTFHDLDFFLDYFETDSTLYLDSVNYQTFNEICIRCTENPSGVDWSFFNNYDDSIVNVLAEGLKDGLSQSGFDCHIATVYRHPQTVFAVIEGYASDAQGYTILYCTGVKINNKFYTITITGICSTREKDEAFATNVLDVVNTLKISGYPDFEAPLQNNSPDMYQSEFQLFDGEHFGDDFSTVIRNENNICDVEGSIHEVPTWSRIMSPHLTYSKALDYDNITFLDVDYSSKHFLFDENDILYSVFYEFRSGYDLDLSGQDDINNFSPAYNAVELYLRDLYGNPHYQYKKGTKAEINGHGMREANFLVDGMDSEQWYDYSEWVIEDPAGLIKIEHIMYFTGYIYKHNVSIEIIR